MALSGILSEVAVNSEHGLGLNAKFLLRSQYLLILTNLGHLFPSIYFTAELQREFIGEQLSFTKKESDKVTDKKGRQRNIEPKK